MLQFSVAAAAAAESGRGFVVCAAVLHVGYARVWRVCTAAVVAHLQKGLRCTYTQSPAHQHTFSASSWSRQHYFHVLWCTYTPSTHTPRTYTSCCLEWIRFCFAPCCPFTLIHTYTYPSLLCFSGVRTPHVSHLGGSASHRPLCATFQFPFFEFLLSLVVRRLPSGEYVVQPTQGK